jgi:transcriptional regulator with XRE-family HTH domain
MEHARIVARIVKTIHAKAYALLVARLKEARRAAGVSQQDLARRLGCPQSFVSKYEHTERRLDVLEFLRIAAALRLDPCVPIREMLAFLETPRNVSRIRGRATGR